MNREGVRADDEEAGARRHERGQQVAEVFIHDRVGVSSVSC
jgi:hypothetical protein